MTIRAQVHMPTYPNNQQSLRTQFPRDARRPSMIEVYKRDKRGRLVLVQAVLPGAAIR